MTRQSFPSPALYASPIRFAPLRCPAYLASLERQLEAKAQQQIPEPWDPWPPERIGYGPPSDSRQQSLFLPTQEHMRRLEAYLRTLPSG
jgi:hypothetical protein